MSNCSDYLAGLEIGEGRVALGEGLETVSLKPSPVA
jgi:hypothetical protein